MGVKPKVSAKLAKSQAVDELIMGTNSSSIVSKRSVERLYYPNEPHFFRYFVSKFQRRAPLINRGYWLRLRAIDVVVRNFLASDSSKKKVVINLGCGSDVLPWQCHTRYAKDCENAIFVDVDYPDLMRKKRAIVLGTPQLRELLGPEPVISEKDTDQVLLRSKKYCQLGCDLRRLDLFRETLETFLDLSNCAVLFIAEVSVTYMDTPSADALIHWASSIGKAEFCLLEQILPNGPHHPFSKTMLSHFDKLNTSLKSVHQYPTVESQKQRFNERGWQSVHIWDLWQAWNDDTFLSSVERMNLDEVEPFDEWEEFVLFARHYTVVHASAAPGQETSVRDQLVRQPAELFKLKVDRVESLKAPRRRFGAPMMVSNVEGQRYAVHTLGMDMNGRSPSCDIYTLDGSKTALQLSPTGPGARMCHTLTDLENDRILLAGGRGSPTSVFNDCWIFKKQSCSWEKTFDLPISLFRHSAVQLKGSSLALVIGGKTGPSTVSSDCFIYHPLKGWIACEATGSGPKPEPVFGASAFMGEDPGAAQGLFSGYLCGGITKDGIISNQAYRWKLDMNESQPSISWEALASQDQFPLTLSVFGAQVVDMGGAAAICGGVGQPANHQGQGVTVVSLGGKDRTVYHAAPSAENCREWPFMVGSSAISLGNSIQVFGGGATCFSMGTCWETGVYLIEIPDAIARAPAERPVAINFVESPKLVSGSSTVTASRTAKATVTEIQRVKLSSKDDFQQLLQSRKPAIIEGLDLGACLSKWTPQYMVEQLGEEKQVVVHECQSQTENMDFNSKNFQYVTESFKSLMNRAEAGDRLYLRSLSEERPSEAPANIEQDFPSLAQEFRIPSELQHVGEHLFSSVLRISGRVNMWLHYDVMANIYTQIRGSKRMILFPPKDVTHLSFAPGASSSSLDVFSLIDSPQLASTHPHEALLNPGDVLFLPPMWFHTATPTTDMSIAVNVFFRDLESGYSAGRDVYGNRDLAAYEKGRQDIGKIAKSFDCLPEDIRRFYLARLAEELMHSTKE